MGPKSNKRKLNAASAPAPKRSKNGAAKPAATKSKSKPLRRTVDAAGLGWKSVDEDEFGGLQVVENVKVVKNGNKVEFVATEDPDDTEQRDNADESFEGFGDDPVEGEAVDTGKAGDSKDGLAAEDAQEPAPSKKKKQQKESRAVVKDSELEKNKAPESSAQGNSFSALQGHEEEDDGVDVAAWADLNLSPRMLSALARLGFGKPTNIQQKAVPEIIAGEDVIGKAQTGSGKTLAFGIPIVEKWLDSNDGTSNNDDDGEREKEGPLALIMSPTRELAKQIGDHIKALCEGLSSAPYVCVITGGLSIQKQRRQLAQADIVIGTPGRLWEVLEGDAKVQEVFTKIQFLVVDEADRLFKAGQFKEAEDVIGALDRKDPEADSDDDSDDEDLSPRQTLVFSATFDKELQTKLAGRKTKVRGDDGGQMGYLMKRLRFRRRPKFIDVNPVRQMAEGLKEGLIECGAMEKVSHGIVPTLYTCEATC